MGKNYLSFTVAVILQALENGYQYGFDIMDVTGLPSGTVYPALRRLEGTGYVGSKGEKHGIGARAARPPPKKYGLTKEGKEALAEAVKRYRLLEQTQAQPETKPKPSRAQ